MEIKPCKAFFKFNLDTPTKPCENNTWKKGAKYCGFHSHLKDNWN